MKTKLMLVVLFMLAMSNSAHASKHESARDAMCLAIGKYAQIVAESRELGRKEDDMIASVTDKTVKKSATQIINFIYTMELKPNDARQLVYLKCLGGGFSVPN